MSRTRTDVALDVAFFRRWMAELTRAVEGGWEELTRLDAAIGDADHGVNMLRGMRAVMALLDADGRLDTPAVVLSSAGSRLVTVVGGAAGPLYGTAFRAMGAAVDGRATLDLPALGRALHAGLEGIQRMGAAEAGDKTIVDTWLPASAAFREAVRGPLAPALARAERAAVEGMRATIAMRARKGRASYLGWRSEGHQDPGATSAHMVFSSLLAAAR